MVLEKSKRQVSESTEVEQSYKFREDPFLERVALEIKAKRQQRIRRVKQRMREKQCLEDAERKL